MVKSVGYIPLKWVSLTVTASNSFLLKGLFVLQIILITHRE